MDSTIQTANRLKYAINTEQDDITSNCSTRKTIEWSFENEEILAEWCDVAQCYKWLNIETYKYYKNVNSYLTIPCIVLSTISGTASFGIPSIPLEYQYIVPFFAGFITIGVGVITTIQQYYRFSELKETHRILSIAWDKVARSIRIELSKEPMERIDARHFIKFTSIEFERLMENSEIIPDFIINKFNLKIDKDETIEGVTTIETVNYSTNKTKLLKRPDICGKITSINENRRIWFSQNNENSSYNSIFTNEEQPRVKHSPKKKTSRKYNSSCYSSSNEEPYVSSKPTSNEEPYVTSKQTSNEEPYVTSKQTSNEEPYVSSKPTTNEQYILDLTALNYEKEAINCQCINKQSIEDLPL